MIKINDNIGTVEVTVRVPLYIDLILKKDVEDITDKERTKWEKFISDDFECSNTNWDPEITWRDFEGGIEGHPYNKIQEWIRDKWKEDGNGII